MSSCRKRKQKQRSGRDHGLSISGDQFSVATIHMSALDDELKKLSKQDIATVRQLYKPTKPLLPGDEACHYEYGDKDNCSFTAYHRFYDKQFNVAGDDDVSATDGGKSDTAQAVHDSYLQVVGQDLRMQNETNVNVDNSMVSAFSLDFDVGPLFCVTDRQNCPQISPEGQDSLKVACDKHKEMQLTCCKVDIEQYNHDILGRTKIAFDEQDSSWQRVLCCVENTEVADDQQDSLKGAWDKQSSQQVSCEPYNNTKVAHDGLHSTKIVCDNQKDKECKTDVVHSKLVGQCRQSVEFRESLGSHSESDLFMIGSDNVVERNSQCQVHLEHQMVCVSLVCLSLEIGRLNHRP